MKNGVHISNLAIGYNHKTILENINLESETNKMIALFGRNGQGKSTLLKTISGLLPSINGNFKFEGIDILKAFRKRKSKTVKYCYLQLKHPLEALQLKILLLLEGFLILIGWE